MGVRVKICGVTLPEDADMAASLGADMIGINFYPPSPRCLPIERAAQVVDAVGRRARLVGVFVNAERAYIRERLDALGLDLLQFHGDEDDDALAGWPVPVIRALRLRGSSEPPALASVKADYVLVDTFHPALYGGTGRARPLQSLHGLDLKRVFISGGLTPDNVAEAAALRPYAVDVASGVESAPGVKDPDKLRSFVANAKSSR
ncbi:MAG TPA: phosphoribosylanthranilate isomerase [Candidatus Binataceae bacterium]|jgi:phosphoribosylanthranilate isomerase|nr:phosphoribosylanthranilate isomerase [Candidatus Binataceae bacterium]